MAFNLNKEIGFKSNKTSYPTKTTINFISNKQAKNDKIALIIFAIFMLCLAVFVKLAVLNPLSKINQAERNYRIMEAQLDTYRDQLKDYNEVEAKYNELVGSFLTDTELSYLNRLAIIDMIEDDIMKFVDVKSWAISNNTIRITTGNTTMDTVSKIVNVLNTDSRNSYVNVTTTKAEKNANDYVVANIVVTYSGAGE